jgi:hypothetical protein
MTSDLLRRIEGKTVSHFSLVKYLHLGIERVLVHLSCGRGVNLRAKEIKLGKDEAYTIEAEESRGEEGIERIEADWLIGSVRIIKRQDWIEPLSRDMGQIGSNPRVHTWGAVGTVPEAAEHLCTVDFGVVLTAKDRDRQAMIYLADYPGLVCFTTKAVEINFLRDSYQAAEPSSCGQAD